jgi:hypothetical protein
MQFLEWSTLGLRSARHVFADQGRNRSVTLFPMVHIGEVNFYSKIYADAGTHDFVVIEGIKSEVSRKLTRTYRWLAPERLGLIVQPKFVPNSLPTLLADLQGEEFDRRWRASPWLERTLFEGAATMMGLWLRFTASRASIGRHLCTTDLPDRETVLAWSEVRGSMMDALLGARDVVLCNSVLGLIAQHDGPRRIAVLYGAGHMGALAHELTNIGFRPVSSEWMTVFSEL